jgi:UDP-N-acetyl-D-mannosaminuronic acid dehydrogenase
MEISQELDEVVKGADVVAIMTGFDEYFGLDAGILKGWMGQEQPVIVDGRNVVEPDEFISGGFVYKGIGCGDKNEHQMK